MFQLNEKVKNLTPYEPISGTYEIRLDANESFLKFTEEIENEMVEALKNTDFNRYPDPNATKLVEGFSEYFNIDATIIRLLLVACVLFAGVGVLAYIIAWIVMPENTGNNNYNNYNGYNADSGNV